MSKVQSFSYRTRTRKVKTSKCFTIDVHKIHKSKPIKI